VPGTAGAQGPPGPTAVSANANNSARLGSDGLIWVPPIGASQWDGLATVFDATATSELDELRATIAALTARVASLESQLEGRP